MSQNQNMTLGIELIRIIKAAKRNEASSLGHLYEHEAVDELKKIIADREKKMLEFVIPKKKKPLDMDKIRAEHWKYLDLEIIKHTDGKCYKLEDIYYNQAIDEIRQRAKEWSKKNG